MNNQLIDVRVLGVNKDKTLIFVVQGENVLIPYLIKNNKKDLEDLFGNFEEKDLELLKSSEFDSREYDESYIRVSIMDKRDKKIGEIILVSRDLRKRVLGRFGDAPMEFINKEIYREVFVFENKE